MTTPEAADPAASDPIPSEETSGEAGGPLAGLRVLVIDDEAPVANFVADALRAHGLEPVVAVDGLAGLEAFRESRPGLIFCDLLIPKRNGFQLLEDFRREAPAVPVVAMSGIYRRERYPEELTHARLFLTKPLDLVQVKEAIELLREQAREAAQSRDAQPSAVAPQARRSREPWIPLSVLPLPKLLHLLWSDRRTGLVTVRHEETRIVLMIEEGSLQFVRTNDPELRLDRVLLQLGRVTPQALQAAQDDLASRSVPTRLGEVLVEQGALTRPELDRAIQVQLRRIVASAFGLTEGETLFSAETLPPGEDVVIGSDLRAVILSGCMSVRDHGESLLGHLPDGACTVQAAPGGADAEIRMPVAVTRLLEAVEEPTRLSDFVAMADLLGMRGRWVAFGLLCCDALALGGSGDTWRSAASRAGSERELAGVPAEMLLGLEEEKATGVLHVSWGSVSAWLALADGRLVQAGSSDARTRIGGLLRTAGLVSPEQLEAALKEQTARPGRPIGNVLVEMGLLSATALRTALPAQVASVAREACSRASWDTATFMPRELPEREPLEVPESVSDIVLGALREMDEKSLFDAVEALAPGRSELDLAALREGRFTLTEGEEMIADALSPDTSHLLEALTSAERMDVEVLRVLAMALLATPVAAFEPA